MINEASGISGEELLAIENISDMHLSAHIQKFVDTHAFHKCMVMGSQLVHSP